MVILPPAPESPFPELQPARAAPARPRARIGARVRVIAFLILSSLHCVDCRVVPWVQWCESWRSGGDEPAVQAAHLRGPGVVLRQFRSEAGRCDLVEVDPPAGCLVREEPAVLDPERAGTHVVHGIRV